jgi:hypothetical protein
MQSESRPVDVTALHSTAWLAQTQMLAQSSTASSSLSSSTFTGSSSTSTTFLAAAAAATVPPPPQPPSEQDVALLRQAFAQFYGAALSRDLVVSDRLLTQTIDRWEFTKQPADERAGLYRVRGDCRMLAAQAVDAAADYNRAVQLLQSDPVAAAAADPAELPAALLGRARAVKSQTSGTANKAKAKMSSTSAVTVAADYEQALKLSSREEWDTEQELLEDGASRNPFAVWEW